MSSSINSYREVLANQWEMDYSRPSTMVAESKTIPLLLLILLHIPLAIAMKQFTGIATLHGWGTLIIGILWILAGKKDQSLERGAYLGAYITGAEVLWRMTDARVFWEYGKYGVVLIAVITLLHTRKFRLPAGPLLYFVLLTPSIFLTINSLGFSNQARQAISFNLSGPLAVLITSAFFARWQPHRAQIYNLFASFLIPIAGIGAIAIYTTLTAQTIRFTDASNFTTSGGFGPNQVSAVLGLGALVAIWLFLLEKRSTARWLLAGITIWLLAQSAFTFSRGGLFNVVVSIILLLLHISQRTRERQGLIALVALILLISGLFVYPKLESITGGAIQQRFTDTSTTGRIDIMKADINIWFNHPIAGVGPGMANFYRLEYLLKTAAAHTEFTRMLAEHGFLGALALFILILIVWRAYLKAPTGIPKAIVVTMAVWAFAAMSHAAMRIVAISFLYGITFIDWSQFNISEASPEQQ